MDWLKRIAAASAAVIVGMTAGSAPAASGDSPSTGLVSYYDFEGSSADRAELYTSGSGASADDLAGGKPARFVNGIVGQAIAIGITADDPAYYEAPDSSDVILPSTFTIEAWINPSDLAGEWHRFVLRWGAPLSYHFAIHKVGGIDMVSLYVTGMTHAEGGQVLSGVWQHVAAVADGTDIRVYLNGEEVASQPYAGIDGTLGEGLGLGDAYHGPWPSLRYRGLVDELAIWNVALTPNEILSHFEAQDMGYGLMKVTSSAKDILTFVFPDLPATTISGTSITLTVPFGTNVTALVPTYTMSPLAAGDPASGTSRNFTNPQTYTITAQDGTTKVYTVTVTVATGSSAKDILTFVFPGLPAVTISGTSIALTVPFGTSVTALAPTYTVSPLAAGDPASGTSRNFTNPQTYTITAQDSSTKVYTVTVTVAQAAVNWIGGDGNGDGKTDISDAVALLTFLFVDDTKTLACLNTMEMNGDIKRDISDAVFLLTFLFVDDTKAPYGDPTYTKKCVKIEGCGIEDPSCK